MVMPSILTLAIGAAVLVVLSALLRYLDDNNLSFSCWPDFVNFLLQSKALNGVRKPG